jgi:hypothetical protein
VSRFAGVPNEAPRCAIPTLLNSLVLNSLGRCS